MSLNGRCTSLLRVVVSEMTYTVSSGTLNSTILYHTCLVGLKYSFDCCFYIPRSYGMNPNLDLALLKLET